MASLKEIKGHIQSVKSTLKITAAMKMVASAKLRKAQSAIEGMLPYEQMLRRTLDEVTKYVRPDGNWSAGREPRRVVLVCFSSNSSLCGGFNANVIREAKSRLAQLRADGVEEITVYSIGRKIADALRKAGYPSPVDYTTLSAKPAYEEAAELSDRLVKDFLEGRIDRVELIYNHFVNAAAQRPVRETYLPITLPPAGEEESADEYIIEPDKEELLSTLLPKTLKLKIYTVLLDSAAAEHAARTIAMQTASDNAEDLLQELSLEYNKSRQAKITAEILDLAGGMQQQ